MSTKNFEGINTPVPLENDSDLTTPTYSPVHHRAAFGDDRYEQQLASIESDLASIKSFMKTIMSDVRFIKESLELIVQHQNIKSPNTTPADTESPPIKSDQAQSLQSSVRSPSGTGLVKESPVKNIKHDLNSTTSQARKNYEDHSLILQEVNKCKPKQLTGNPDEWAVWYSVQKRLLDCYDVNSEAYKFCWKCLLAGVPQEYKAGRPTEGTIAEQADALNKFIETYDERQVEWEGNQYKLKMQTLHSRSQFNRTKKHIRDMFAKYGGRDHERLRKILLIMFSEEVVIHDVDIGYKMTSIVGILPSNHFDIRSDSVCDTILKKLEKFEDMFGFLMPN